MFVISLFNFGEYGSQVLVPGLTFLRYFSKVRSFAALTENQDCFIIESLYIAAFHYINILHAMFPSAIIV